MTEPARRVVLLGASNLTRGISPAVELGRRAAGGPAEFLIAMGHGRSFGTRSRILGRSLPGIIECGLWDALERRPAHATRGLITDVGNDVLYGASVDTILGWVTECLDRLQAAGARVAMGLPPMGSIRTLTPWRYRVARALLFPGRPLSMTDALSRAGALSEGLRRLGESRGVRVVEPPAAWYGLDPIHPRRRHLAESWAVLLEDGGGAPARPVGPSPARWLRLRTLTPRQWWLLGRPLGRPQPAARLRDGSTISLY